MLEKQAIANAFLDNNSRDFWAELSKIRKKSNKNSCFIDGCSNNDDSSACFSNHYKELYNSVSFRNDDWNELYNSICCDMKSDCKDQKTHVISYETVDNAIKNLKPGKSDGFDGLTTDYIINSSPLLYTYLAHLFTCMLSHCCIPKSFSMSTMIPIPKGSNKDLTDVKNYRGIALSSLLSKILDNCIISSHEFIFQSDELQFAYKKKHINCSMCFYSK